MVYKNAGINIEPKNLSVSSVKTAAPYLLRHWKYEINIIQICNFVIVYYSSD